MARVGKYYGVRLGDAIKFMWMDATFAVERRADKLKRERRAAGMKSETEEAKTTSVNTEAAAKTTNEDVSTQDTTEATAKKPGFFANLFGRTASTAAFFMAIIFSALAAYFSFFSA